MALRRGHIVIEEKVSRPIARALDRPRLTNRMRELAHSGVGYVHGAAGIGKTTVLAQLSNEWPGPVAWVRLDHGDASEERVIALLSAALDLSLDPDSASVDHLIAALDEREHDSTLVVIDDVHSVDGSDAADTIDRLLRYRPRHVSILMASRHALDPIRRSRIGGVEPMVLDFEDLRFRLWEVDDLMRDHHDISIAPGDLSLLCRYTDGWAAALRLFSVASRETAPEQRRQLISGLRTSAGMVHDYLMSETLSSLDAEASTFLIKTSVFEHITPERATRLLGVDSAATMLRDIQAVGLFTTTGASAYVCHDLLRGHLLSRLPEEVGEDEALALQLHAAAIADSENAPAEAIRYYARAGDADAVRRILHVSGATLSSAPGRWIEALPQAMRDQDPFVLLTNARHLVRHGDLEEALSSYRRAVDLLDTGHGARRGAQTELRRVDAWRQAGTAPVADWVGGVRQLLHDRAVPARRSIDDPFRLAEGVAHFLQGDLAAAEVALADGEQRADGLTAIVCGALLLLIDLLREGIEGCSPGAIRRVQQAAKRTDARAVERVVGAVARGGINSPTDDPLVEECRQAGDALGGGLVLLVSGVALAHESRATPAPFDEAAELFQADDYHELAFLARCFAAASGGVVEDLAGLEAAARRRGRLPQMLVALARPSEMSAQRVAPSDEARLLARRIGLHSFAERICDRETTEGPEAIDEPGMACVRALGGLVLEVEGAAMIGDLTPLHQEILALLVVHVDEWISRDRLMITFWPDKPESRASRSLQVAISKVRLELERLELGSIERNGPRYTFVPAPGVEVDLRVLRELLTCATNRDRSTEQRSSSVEDALRIYREPVEDLGAVDWAANPRRELRLALSSAALDVARLHQAEGDDASAARIAELTVRVDPGEDEAWQLAFATVGAARSRELRREYDRYIAT